MRRRPRLSKLPIWTTRLLLVGCLGPLCDVWPAQAAVGIFADSVATRHTVELRPLQPRHVYVVALVDTDSVEIARWKARLTGAVANPGNGLHLVSVRPTSATNHGTNLAMDVPLTRCKAASQSAPFVLATVTIQCDDTFSDGRILVRGFGTTTTAELEDCGGTTYNAFYNQDLDVVNVESSGEESRLSMAWDHTEFPPRSWEVLAGVGRVDEFDTPVYHPRLSSPRSHVQVAVERSMVGIMGREVTLLLESAVWEADGSVRMKRRHPVGLVYPRVGSRIVFVAARRPLEFWNYYEDTTCGVPTLYFVRFLNREEPLGSDPVYTQAEAYIREAGAPFEGGRFDSTVIEQTLEPDGRSLDEVIHAIQEYYGSD